jgi:hypothetical protein
MSDNAEWGPLAALIGEWEGDHGLDFAYANAESKVKDTPYREKTSMKPFGPVENGSQVLYGLDYRMAAWRGSEENPFHTEVGYWLWDAADGQVFRCFVVPRGSLVLAGGDATADATDFTMHAECGSETYGVLSNRFLSTAARTSSYKCLRRAHRGRARAFRRSRRAHRPQPAAPRLTRLTTLNRA